MTIVEAVGWILLHFVWQGAAIALALAALLALTGEAQAKLRYALSCGALALMLAAALVTTTKVLTVRPGVEPAVASAGALAQLPMSASDHGASVARPEGTPPANRTAIAEPRAVPASGRSGLARRILAASMPWLVGTWMVGVLLLSVRLLGGWWRTHTLRVTGVAPVPEWCQQQLAALSTRLQITRPVAIVSSVRLSVPVIVGHARPLIVLPAAVLSGLSADQLEAILAHELAHVRRHDYLVNLIQTLIETLLFYHPAVWWVSRQVRVSREHCCDDLAVTVCRSRHDYVHALVDLEQLRGTSPGLALGATDGSLLARGRRLLAPTAAGASSVRLAASVIGLTVVAAAAASAALTPPMVPSAMPVVESSADAAADHAAAPAPPPQATPAVRVTTAPDTTGTLDSRWTWAERAAQTARQQRYWVGYSVEPVKTLPAFIYFDRDSKVLADRAAFTGHLMSTTADGLRFPGRPLAVGSDGSRSIKLLFQLDTRRGGATLAGVHASTLSMPVDTSDLPVFWLGSADAAQSLDRIDRFYQAASSANLKDDVLALAAVHDLSARVVSWLEQRVASQDPDEVRANAAEWMAYHPIEASLRALDRIARNDRSTQVRQEAAEALGDLAMPEAAPVLIALARSLKDLDARREAVEALGSRPEPAAREALASIAREDAVTDIQREAVETLGDLQDRSGVPLLQELARTHPDTEVRREAIETLGDAVPPETAVPMLEQFAKDDTDRDIRREAIEGLASRAADLTGAEQQTIVDLLARLAASDRDLDVQLEATESLGEIGGAAALAALRKLAESHQDEQVRAEAVETLGESRASSKDTVSVLKQIALTDKSHQVQAEAMETLADLADGAGIPALIDLARDHADADARRQALETLLESEHPAARAVFDRALGKKR